MKDKDITEKHLEDYNDVFSDIVNVLLFNGENVIAENELENTKDKSQYKANNKIHEQERDVTKFWKKGNVIISLVGLENQTTVDKDMSLRIMSYDGASYKTQLLKSENSERYPVVTLVLYFGTERWNKNLSLYERLNIPKEMKPYVSDYKINVFEIAHLTDEQVGMFKSDFKIVADYFVQIRKNKLYVPSEDTIKHVDEVLKLMTALTGDSRYIEVQRQGNGGVKNMCEAMERAEQKGIEKGKFLTLTELVRNGNLSIDIAAETAGMTTEEFKELLEEK